MKELQYFNDYAALSAKKNFKVRVFRENPKPHADDLIVEDEIDYYHMHKIILAYGGGYALTVIGGVHCNLSPELGTDSYLLYEVIE